ncbi:uncharacterized protein GJ701_003498 [Geothlypis trichas]
MGKSPCSAQRPSRTPALPPVPFGRAERSRPAARLPPPQARPPAPALPAAVQRHSRGWSGRGAGAGAQPGWSTGRAAPSQRAERSNLPRPGERAPLCREATRALSISSIPDLMGIKIQYIKLPARPSGLWCPLPGLLEGDTYRLFLALPRPSPPKAAETRREGAYLPRRSFPLERSRRAAPALSPQPGAPEVPASGSQLGRQRQLHSPRDEEPLTVGGGGGRWRGPDSSRDAPPRWPPPPPPSSALSGACPLRAVPRCRPAASVRPARLPPPSPQRRTARRTGPAGGQEDPGATGDSGPASCPLPGAWCTLSAGRGGPAPAWRSAPGRSPAQRSRERRGSLQHRRGPSIAAGPESATAGCRAPTGFAPFPCLETAPESECQAAPFPFLPSFLASRPFPAVSLPPPAPSGARCQAAPCGCRGQGGAGSGCRCRSGGCREPHALRRASPGWLSGGCSARVSVSCLCLGGRRRGPRRGQPALTPPSDRRRAPNQRRLPPRSARPRSGAPRAATPGQRGGGPAAVTGSPAREGSPGPAPPPGRRSRAPPGAG